MQFQEDLVFAKFDTHGKPDGYENHLRRLIKRMRKSKNETINRVQVFENYFKFTKPSKKAPKHFETSKIVKIMKTNASDRSVCFVYPGNKPDTKWIVGLRFKEPQGYNDFIDKLERKEEPMEIYVPPTTTPTPSSTTSPPPSETKRKKHRKSHSVDVATSFIDTEKLRHMAPSNGESDDIYPRQTSFIAANKNNASSLLQGLDKNCRMKRISGAVAVQVDKCGRPIQSMPCNVYTYECDMTPCGTSSSSSSSSTSSLSSSFTELQGQSPLPCEYFCNDWKRGRRTHRGNAGRRTTSEGQAKYYIQRC